jgi:hypothetical protein
MRIVIKGSIKEMEALKVAVDKLGDSKSMLETREVIKDKVTIKYQLIRRRIVIDIKEEFVTDMIDVTGDATLMLMMYSKLLDKADGLKNKWFPKQPQVKHGRIDHVEQELVSIKNSQSEIMSAINVLLSR